MIWGWGTLCTKEHIILRNILLLKSWTHLAAQHTWQSHNLLLSTPCSLTPFATQNPLLLITPSSSTLFTSQNTLFLKTLCFSTPFAPWNTLLLRTLCSLTPFPPWNNLLLRTLCSQTPLAPWNTLLLNTLFSLEHFAPQHIMILGIHLTMMWNRYIKQDSESNFRVKNPNSLLYIRDCFPKFANGLNIKIGIAQKVFELWNCSFAKIIFPSGEKFGKRRVS